MRELQESDYGEGRDYSFGSPHLTHTGLRNTIEADLRRMVARSLDERGHCRVLEVGAGHGAFTTTLRDAGAEVIVTEMSRPSVQTLQRQFAGDSGVRVVPEAEDGAEALRVAEEERPDLAVFISVLHHIPDYLSAVRQVTAHTGSFYSAQDPLWYPTMGKRHRWPQLAAYYAWRIRQGDTRRGLKTQMRRARGVYDESEPSDMIEYHVVRQGVDQVALEEMLSERFSVVEPRIYWSTQSPVFQRLGDRLGLRSNFIMSAQNPR